MLAGAVIIHDPNLPILEKSATLAKRSHPQECLDIMRQVAEVVNVFF
jgi:hypothetical protein